LGSFEHLQSNSKSESGNRNQDSLSPEKQASTMDQESIKLADRAWKELPYAMMRITAANKGCAGTHLYWQDQTLELGDIDLNLASSPINEHARAYAVTYSVNEPRRTLTRHASPKPRELRRTFIVHPSLEGGEIRWTAPGLSAVSNLNTHQLAEKLVSELVTFYSQGLR